MIRYKLKNGQRIKMTTDETTQFEKGLATPTRQIKTKLEKLSDLMVKKGLLTQIEIDKL